jgi:hypothetical protein
MLCKGESLSDKRSEDLRYEKCTEVLSFKGKVRYDKGTKVSRDNAMHEKKDKPVLVLLKIEEDCIW